MYSDTAIIYRISGSNTINTILITGICFKFLYTKRKCLPVVAVGADQISPSATINNPSQSNTSMATTSGKINIYVWRISNGVCPDNEIQYN